MSTTINRLTISFGIQFSIDSYWSLLMLVQMSRELQAVRWQQTNTSESRLHAVTGDVFLRGIRQEDITNHVYSSYTLVAFLSFSKWRMGLLRPNDGSEIHPIVVEGFKVWLKVSSVADGIWTCHCTRKDVRTRTRYVSLDVLCSEGMGNAVSVLFIAL